MMLYTKVDAQYDKLATDDRRQFITLSVHRCRQNDNSYDGRLAVVVNL